MPKVSGRHVRPVLRKGQVDWYMLQTFRLGAIVDLGAVQAQPAPPEIEDSVFSPLACKRVGQVTPDHFWNIVCSTARTSFHEIFGNVLTSYGPTFYVTQGCGKCSLGELRLHSSCVSLFVETYLHRPRVRLNITMRQNSLRLPVTDVRFHHPPTWQVVEEVVHKMGAMLQSINTDVILSVGLTRPFAPEGFLDPVHWLQVNNVHIPTDPLWQGILKNVQSASIPLQ